MRELVVLVDKGDQNIGEMEKMEAHQRGALHRAFSVFIFNKPGELLLQQRAQDKYHSAGLWTNTCCSHPRPGEAVIDAAVRRLEEEMGMQGELHYRFQFYYKADFENGLIEHELDHVFFGISDEVPVINPDEVADYRYVRMEDLQQDLLLNPQNYTPWLKICFEKIWRQFRML